MAFKEVRFLWKQLNGPQITAIIRALWGYIKDTFNDRLVYLRDLSIETADEKHLEFIGTVMGLRRPVVTSELYYSKLFKFTNDFVNGPDGWAEIYTSEEDHGGFFDVYSYDFDAPQVDLLPIEDYRYLLRSISNNDTSNKSLSLIEAIVRHFCPPLISYSFKYSDQVKGDLIVEYTGRAPYQIFLTRQILNLFFRTSPVITLRSPGDPTNMEVGAE